MRVLDGYLLLDLVKRVPGQGLERRECGKTVLYLLIIIGVVYFMFLQISDLVK